MHFFPKKPSKPEKNFDGLTLGWVGRVTPEKGFHTALNAFIRIRKQLGKARMVVAGGRTTPQFEEWIRLWLEKNGVPPDCLIRLNSGRFMPHHLVWQAYRMFDIFLFPSVSSNESLGRVMIEASYGGVPVIAANHAAAPEILKRKNLLPVEYKRNLLQLAGIGPCGRVYAADIVEKVLSGTQMLQKADISNYAKHDLKYKQILEGEHGREKARALKKDAKEFIDGVRLYQDKPSLAPQKSFERLKEFIANENYAILGMWHFYLNAYMGYNPYVLFFAEDERRFSENARIRLQKLVMKAKNPVKKPFKMYYYHRAKLRAKEMGCL
jgi:hypothetical protein